MLLTEVDKRFFSVGVVVYEKNAMKSNHYLRDNVVKIFDKKLEDGFLLKDMYKKKIQRLL